MWNEIQKIFHGVVNLRETTDTRGTIDSVRQSTAIKGYNIWILACGAMLASIGLDLDSVAVIIGAMLISPLMSPILGVGMAFGINDREHLFLALENFTIAVLASLGVSTLYFLISPFDGPPGPEITSRTMPTVLDVMIALFGGTAGIVAGSRKEKTNAIPGVAIATALMPPICTAGYGLANGEWTIFFGAFYLFFINAVFISLSTFIIVRYLKFPYAEYPDDQSRRRAVSWIIIFAIAVIMPSVYFFYNVITDARMQNSIQTFISQEINQDETHRVSNTEIEKRDSVTLVTLYIAGEPISEQRKRELDSLKNEEEYALDKVKIKYLQQVQLSAEQLTDQSTKTVIQAIDPTLMALRKRLDSIENEVEQIGNKKGLGFAQVKMEAKSLFEELETFTLAEAAYTSNMDSTQTDTLALVVTNWNRRLSRRPQEVAKENLRLQKWLKLVLKKDSVLVISP